MNWFSDLKTRTKLSLSFGFFLVVIGLLILESLTTIKNLSSTNDELYHKQFRLAEYISKIDDVNNTIYSNLMKLILTKEKSDQDQITAELQNKDFTREQLINSISNLVALDSTLEKQFAEFKNLKTEARQIRERELLPAINSNNTEQAKKILFGSLNEKYQKMSDLADTMIQEAKNLAEEGIAETKAQAKRTTIIFGITSLVAVILSIFLIIVLNHLISEPINELSKVARKVSEGNLNLEELSFKTRKDEIGILGSSFKIMVQNLKEMTKEITDVINFLNTSSAEIASATAELSSTAAETATSISETTSTIEEVKQTSQVASQKAKEVSETAQKTSEISQTGKQAADEVNEVINHIQSQMTTVAETMMRLSEQSQLIGDIIASVEDLAQQTNLLAVNASIEASKAGEQGKGFSVVAQEVKSLANQSKQATTQVRSILNDIQKATSAAVMATELGNKAVEAGVEKTGEAGATIISLVDTVSESSQAASQIAAVSHQQLIGMEQAALAMENIKQASTQNVESSKLLNDSIDKIKELSLRLKDLIGRYKIS